MTTMKKMKARLLADRAMNYAFGVLLVLLAVGTLVALLMAEPVVR